MQSNASTPDEYMEQLPEERQNVIKRLREVALKYMPPGFEEVMNYGMMGYVVPHSIYPNGYHCDPKQPLPFYGFASQKGSVNIYHMGIYADKELHDWFVNEYPKHVKTKLDMGKSCIRFKKLDTIPYELIAQLMAKMTVERWIALYEKNLKR
jgi:uncharacterized protein YdhG (YjbR/CyaY superfamily)